MDRHYHRCKSDWNSNNNANQRGIYWQRQQENNSSTEFFQNLYHQPLRIVELYNQDYLNFLYQSQRQEASQSQSSCESQSQSIQATQRSEMTQQDNFEQKELDIQEFILQNNIGEGTRYRLPKNLMITDRFSSKHTYQFTLKELLKLEIISDINRRIQQKDQEIYQKEIKVKLFKHFIFNQQKKFYQPQVILRASNTRNYYFLEQTLIKGKRLGIVTRSLPFTTQNLQNKHYQTRLCFISKDQSTQKIVVRGLDQFQLQHPYEPNQRLYEEDQDKQLDLEKDQYFYIDLDSIVSALRQYRAVCDSTYFPLINQLIGKKQIREDPEQQINRQNYMSSSKIYNSIKDNRNKSQIKAIKNIFLRQAGIYLIQGPPGTGKTQSIVNFASLQQHYFNVKLQHDLCNKLMICAQSNAAVNNIGRKILNDQLIGRKDRPNILRLGHSQQFDQQLLSINLPHLCQITLRGTKNNKDDWSAKLRSEKLSLQAKINRMMKQGRSRGSIRAQKDKLFQKVKRLVEIHLQIQKKMKLYELIQKEYLKASQIVLSTLNTSGKKKFADFYRDKIRCLIIDEASQATQPSTLIPFNTQVQKVILVGDHMQLQPTVMSTNCRHTRFNRSLFQRLISISQNSYLLNKQYRMVQTLKSFPNCQFYEGKLKKGKKIIVPKSLRKLFSSSMFFDVKYGVQQRQRKSYQNKAEANCVSILIGRLMRYDSSLKIGIIAPYKSQIKYLENKIDEVPMSDQARDNIKISTVDAFQGQQMDVIIISCVRSNKQKILGFVNDKKRMNVAITRAKYALFVFGHADTLRIDSTWYRYITYHRYKNSLFQINQQEQSDRRIRRLVQLQMPN